MDRSALDLAISTFPQRREPFRYQLLFEDHWRVLLRKEHPAARNFDLDRWLAYPHILVAGIVPGRAPLDELLASMKRERQIGMNVPGFLMVPELIASSDLIATVPSRCVPTEVTSQFVVLPPPLPLPAIPVHLAWHVRRDADPVIRHVRTLIETLPY